MERNVTITNRITELRNAIAYSRCENRMMNVGEGILCNQEIAAWYGVLSDLEEEPTYTVSEELCEKVKEINRIIKNSGWERPMELYVL